MTGLALFDLDNTLIDRSAAFERWATAFAAAHAPAGDIVGVPADHTEAEIAWLVAADGDGYVTREDFFGAVRERYHLAPSVAELVADYSVRYPASVTVEPAVTAALARLRAAGWRIGIVTNGRDESQRAKLTATGLHAYVDGVVVSGGVGLRKPDPRIFALAATEVGAGLAGGWMVGDHSELDIAGGQRAGLRTIWLHRGRTWPGASPPPDHIAPDIPTAVDHILADSR